MPQKKLPPVWSITPHTKAKHQILEEYLNAWFPILSRWDKRIVYLDGFAGPGKYSKGEDGSPVISINTILNHPMFKNTIEVIFLFIDKDKSRSKILTETLSEKFTSLPSNIKYEITTDNFSSSVKSILDSLEKDDLSLAPTFAFIDPFGYSDFPMDLVTRLLNHKKCEVLINFMSRDINRFRDKSHEKPLDNLFGTPEWKKANSIKNTSTRIDTLLKIYVGELKKRTGARFVRTFRMTDSDGKIIYDLVFATKHHLGMENMKKAMSTVVQNGIYRFSDSSNPDQTYLFEHVEELKEEKIGSNLVFDHFKGQIVPDTEIRDFVLADTPFRKWKPMLKILEKENPTKIISVSNRKTKALTYPPGCIVEFAI